MLTVKDADGFNEVTKTHDLVVVDFFAEWCTKCPAMEVMLDEIRSDFPDIPFLKVDIDAFPELKEQARIKAVPMALIYRFGRIKDFMYGTPDADKMRHKIAIQQRAVEVAKFA